MNVVEQLGGDVALEWHPIPGHSNYQIHRDSSVRVGKSRRIVKPHVIGNYKRIAIVNDEGKCVQYRLCRLMATAFGLPKRDDQNQVDHINGNARDDRVENLRWRTASENIHDRLALKGTISDRRQVYLKFENDEEIGYFPSIRAACKHFDKAIGTLWGVVKMLEEKGSYTWRGYAVTILTKEQFEAQTQEAQQAQQE
jgi:hypothetical protein